VEPRSASVLVVDDDAAVRTLLERILQRDGYTVVTARHGGEAISRLSDGAFDVIVLDVMMPVANGFDVLDYLHERGDGGSRVIVVTAAQPRQLTQLRSDEVCAFVAKPFDLHELCATVARHARS